MNRIVAGIAIAVVCTALIGSSVSEAGWNPRRFNPGRPPRIPSPGPYQQKILNGAQQGAKIGAEAGGQLGPGGSVLGGIQGAVIGGAYADHQHHSNKVHNYRTPQGPFPLTFWSYGAAQGGGCFQRSGNSWIEYKNGRQYAVFQQVGEAGNHVLLYDAGRNMEVKLDFNQALWRTPGGGWSYLFPRNR